MKTRTINVDREQAGQLCTKESVLMQMTLKKMAGKQSSGDGSQSQFTSPEDAEGLLKGIITALSTVSEGPTGSIPLGLRRTQQKRPRGEVNSSLDLMIFLVPILQTPKVLLFKFRTK